MIHLRMFYYLISAILTLAIFIISLSLQKKDVLKKQNYSFLLFYFFHICHLFFIYAHLYYRFNAGHLNDRGAFLEYAVMVSRFRTIFYVYFAHSLSEGSLHKIYHPVVMSLVLIGSFIDSQITILVVILYVPLYLFISYKAPKQLNNPYRSLMLRFLIVALITVIPILLDLLEGLHLFYGTLFVDFYPLCFILIGFFYLSTFIRRQKIESDSFSFNLVKGNLTDREEEVAQFILRGHTNKEISELLFISESTVKKHINNMFRKLKIKNRWELIKLTEKFT